jgi:hypothetical protein
MNSIDSAFGSVDMEPAAAEINLIPTEVAHLRRTKPAISIMVVSQWP